MVADPHPDPVEEGRHLASSHKSKFLQTFATPRHGSASSYSNGKKKTKTKMFHVANMAAAESAMTRV